ncbi:MAG: hypothetical protein WC743_17645 [Mucilaginibacter sp.]|jgi:hypothetical protein
MKNFSIKNFTLGYLLTVLIISIALSIIIATSVNLQVDELGALLNIYLPVLVGLLTLAVFLVIVLFNNKFNIRITALIICVCFNLLTAISLKLNFYNFLTNLSINKTESNPYKLSFKFSSYASPAVSPGNITIQNMDGFPSNTHLVFSLIYLPYKNGASPKNKALAHNHDRVTVRIKNQNAYNYVISKASFSNKGLWEITRINNINTDSLSFPLSIPPGGSADITIAFTANAINQRITPSLWKALLKLQYHLVRFGRTINYQVPVGSTCLNLNGTLTLETNDKTKPVKTIYLRSIWQYRAESDWEPELQRVLNVLNFKTKVGFKNFDNGLRGDNITELSDEIPADYFEIANKAIPVKVIKIASYHGCCTIEDTDTIGYYYKGQKNVNPLQYTDDHSGQMLLPAPSDALNNYASFTPTRSFALKIGALDTDRNKNYEKKIGIRVWKAINEYGVVIDNAYILGSDYLGKGGTNYDYQDNVYYVENVRPISQKVN